MKYFNNLDDSNIVKQAVIKAALRGNIEDLNRHTEGKFRYWLAKKLGRRTSYKYNYPIGYMYWGISEYLIYDENQELIKKTNALLNKCFNHDGKLKYKISIVDQVPMGCCYINMYCIGKQGRYLEAANEIAEYLKKRFYSDGLLYREFSSVQLVDTLGLVVPFLVKYSELTNDDDYISIANHLVKTFESKAITSNSLVVHGYDTKTNLLLGSANWGRGFGWYLLAKTFLKSKIKCSIGGMNYSHQFICQEESLFDSSSKLLIDYYRLVMEGDFNVDINEYNSMVRKNGLVDYCTGDTNGLNYYASSYGLGGLSNGLYLLFYTKWCTNLKFKRHEGNWI